MGDIKFLSFVIPAAKPSFARVGVTDVQIYPYPQNGVERDAAIHSGNLQGSEFLTEGKAISSGISLNGASDLTFLVALNCNTGSVEEENKGNLYEILLTRKGLQAVAPKFVEIRKNATASYNYQNRNGGYMGSVRLQFFANGLVFDFDFYNRDVGLLTESRVTVYYKTKNDSLFIGGVPPNLQNSKLLRDCPEGLNLTILSQTDSVYGGNNMSAAYFGSSTYRGAHRPLFTSVVRGTGCTLIQKFNSKELQDAVSGSIIAYGLLRYFLWFLITKKWDIQILRQSNTRKFFRTLKKSQYACWVEAFQDPTIRRYGVYFIE